VVVSAVSSKELKDIIDGLVVVFLLSEVEETVAFHVGEVGDLKGLQAPIIILIVNLFEYSLDDITLLLQQVHDSFTPRQDSMAQLLDIAIIYVFKVHFSVSELLDDLPVQEGERHVHHDPPLAVLSVVVDVEEVRVEVMLAPVVLKVKVALVDPVFPKKSLFYLV
jgi:hypothetical protein